MPDTSPHSPLRKRLIIGALLVLGLVAAPFGYQKFKAYRAEKLATQAIDLAGSGEKTAAREAADAAFNLAPRSPASLRAKARSAEELSDTFFFSDALIKTKAANPSDARLYLETCLELDFAANIDQVMQQLVTAEPGRIDNWLLLGRINFKRGQSQLALECAGRALELEPMNRSARLLTAEIAQTSQDETYRNAANATLDKLIAERPDDNISLSAQVARLPDSAAQLLAHPLATAEQQLLAAQHRLLEEKSAEHREKLINATIEKHQQEQLPALLHWLTSSGFAERALTLVDFDKARASSPLFTSWCHAMLSTGRAEELAALLEDPNKHSEIPLASNARNLVLVDAYEAAGKSNIADIHWNKLSRDTQVGNRKGKLLQLAQWSERHGYSHRSISAYRSLAELFPEDTPYCYDRISAIARRSNKLPLLQKITAELQKSTPENLVYKHNFAYLSALAGENLEFASSMLKELIAVSPQAGSARCTLALIEKQGGNDAEVSAQLAQVVPEKLDPIAHYIYLTLSGKPAIPPAEITPYELEAIKSL